MSATDPPDLGPLTPTLLELATTWRTDASRLHAWGADAQATVLHRVADELERALQARLVEVLTLGEAAQVSGYSTDHLARLIREGKLENVGHKHAPRVRRGDLPRKPGALPESMPGSMFSAPRRRIARAVVDSDSRRHDG